MRLTCHDTHDVSELTRVPRVFPGRWKIGEICSGEGRADELVFAGSEG